ncbi:MAG: hypothetical protein JW735_06375, partial [Prolixibacteraceae bacterium]|nr:hypothetical protein [Prolixibacteraceae bacterium]
MKKILLLVLFISAIMFLGAQDTIPVDSVAEQLVENEVVKQQTVDNSSILISEESSGFGLVSFLRGLLGIIVLLALGWIFSNNKKAIPWKTVFVGLALQILLAVGILNVPFVRWIFEFFGKIFVVILDFTKEGTNFLFEGFLDVDKFGYVFAFQVLPTIIFFSALTSLLFYFGVIQIVVKGLAYVFSRLMGLSGAEALSVAGNIFLGQTESPLMIKGYLSSMSDSEML